MRRLLTILASVMIVVVLAGCEYIEPGGAPGSVGRVTPGDDSVADQATGNYDESDGGTSNPESVGEGDSAELGYGRSPLSCPGVTGC